MPARGKRRRMEREEEQREGDDGAADGGLSPPTRPVNPQAAPTSTSSVTSGATRLPVPVSSLHLPPPVSASSSSSSSGSLSAPAARSRSAKMIVVLVKASLETIRTKQGYELVTADSHRSILQRLKQDPAAFRPDIVHQCLLTLLDSPLNKAGLLQVFVQTDKHVLIEVSPAVRIPRTFKRFAGLMVQLLHKLKIRAADSNDYLLRVIKNPVTDHLPAGSLRIGTSVQGTLVDVHELAERIGGGQKAGAGLAAPVVFCVGSHSTGPAVVDWTEQSISISQYPLSASVALGRIINAFERAWHVL